MSAPLNTDEILRSRCAVLSGLAFKPSMYDLLRAPVLNAGRVVEEFLVALGEPAGKHTLVLAEKSKVPEPKKGSSAATAMEVEESESETDEEEKPAPSKKKKVAAAPPKAKAKAKAKSKPTPPPSPSMKPAKAAVPERKKKKETDTMEDVSEGDEEEEEQQRPLKQIYGALKKDELHEMANREKGTLDTLAHGARIAKECAGMHEQFKKWIAVQHCHMASACPEWFDKIVINGAHLVHHVADCANLEGGTTMLKWLHRNLKVNFNVLTQGPQFGIDHEATPLEVAQARRNKSAVQFIKEVTAPGKTAATAALKASSKKSIAEAAEKKLAEEEEEEDEKMEMKDRIKAAAAKSKAAAAAAAEVKEPSKEMLVTLSEAEHRANDAREKRQELAENEGSYACRYQNTKTGALRTVVMGVALKTKEDSRDWDFGDNNDNHEKLVGSKFRQWEEENPDWKPLGNGERTRTRGKVNGVEVIECPSKPSATAILKAQGKETTTSSAAPRVTQTRPWCDVCDERGEDCGPPYPILDDKRRCPKCVKKHSEAVVCCMDCKAPLTADNRVKGLAEPRCVKCNKGYATSPLAGACSGKDCKKKDLRNSEVHKLFVKKTGDLHAQFCTPCFKKQEDTDKYTVMHPTKFLGKRCIGCDAELSAAAVVANGVTRCGKCARNHKCDNPECAEKSIDTKKLHAIKDGKGVVVKGLCEACFKKSEEVECAACKKTVLKSDTQSGHDVKANKDIGPFCVPCYAKVFNEVIAKATADSKHNPELKKVLKKVTEKQQQEAKTTCQGAFCHKKFLPSEMQDKFNTIGDLKKVCGPCAKMTDKYFDTPKTTCAMQHKKLCSMKDNDEDLRCNMHHGLDKDGKSVFYCDECQPERKAGGLHLKGKVERNCTTCGAFMDDDETDEDGEPTTVCESCMDISCENCTNSIEADADKFKAPNRPRGCFLCADCYSDTKSQQPCVSCKKLFRASGMWEHVDAEGAEGLQCRGCHIDEQFAEREKKQRGPAICGGCTKKLTKQDVNEDGELLPTCVACRIKRDKPVCKHCSEKLVKEDFTAPENTKQTPVCRDCRKVRADCGKCEVENLKKDLKRSSQDDKLRLCGDCKRAEESEDEDEEVECDGDCNSSFAKRYMTKVHDDYFCDDCHEEKYGAPECGECGENFPAEDMVEPEHHNITDEDGNGVRACKECVEKDNKERKAAGEIECHTCSKHFTKDKIHPSRAGDKETDGTPVMICDDCDDEPHCKICKKDTLADDLVGGACESCNEKKHAEPEQQPADKLGAQLERNKADLKRQSKEERESDSDSEGGRVIKSKTDRIAERAQHIKTTLKKSNPVSPVGEENPKQVTFSPSTAKGLSDSTEKTQELETPATPKQQESEIRIPETPEAVSATKTTPMEDEEEQQQPAPTQAASAGVMEKEPEENFSKAIKETWNECKDEDGNSYWFNYHTKASSWDKPTESEHVTVVPIAKPKPPPRPPAKQASPEKKQATKRKAEEEQQEEKKKEEEDTSKRARIDPSPTSSTPPLTQADPAQMTGDEARAMLALDDD